MIAEWSQGLSAYQGSPGHTKQLQPGIEGISKCPWLLGALDTITQPWENLLSPQKALHISNSGEFATTKKPKQVDIVSTYKAWATNGIYSAKKRSFAVQEHETL